MLTTIYSVLGKKHISLVGGTGDGGKVSVNGKIYADADAYSLIRNNDGKIKVYKEIYISRFQLAVLLHLRLTEVSIL